jgi:hypothetical protein
VSAAGEWCLVEVHGGGSLLAQRTSDEPPRVRLVPLADAMRSLADRLWRDAGDEPPQPLEHEQATRETKPGA